MVATLIREMRPNVWQIAKVRHIAARCPLTTAPRLSWGRPASHGADHFVRGMAFLISHPLRHLPTMS